MSRDFRMVDSISARFSGTTSPFTCSGVTFMLFFIVIVVFVVGLVLFFCSEMLPLLLLLLVVILAVVVNSRHIKILDTFDHI